MTAVRDSERDLPARLTDLAAEHRPDYLDDAFFGDLAHVRQRSAWAFPERWLPMDITTTPAASPRLPWSAIGVLALVALLIGTVIAVVAGTQRDTPVPYGPAANGLIAYADAGDIHTVDPTTGQTTAIVAGPETDTGPVFSRDGTQIAFLRSTSEGSALFVADADGKNIVRITPGPMLALGYWSFSPDGTAVLTTGEIDGQMRAFLVPTDGSGNVTVLDVPLPADAGEVEAPSFRPTGGTEVLVVGLGESQRGNRGLFAVDVASGDVRTILAPDPVLDLYGASWSPDGSRIMYAKFGGTDGFSSKTHVIAADGGGDARVDDHPGSIGDTPGQWSNDGTRVVITRVLGADGSLPSAVVVPANGSDGEVEIQCRRGAAVDPCSASWTWAPDDSALLGTVEDENGRILEALLADPLTGHVQDAALPASTSLDWQRVRP
jgi:Tol biopolymer transport system component